MSYLNLRTKDTCKTTVGALCICPISFEFECCIYVETQRISLYICSNKIYTFIVEILFKSTSNKMSTQY